MQQQHQQWQQQQWGSTSSGSTWEADNNWEPEPKRRHGPRGGKKNPNVWWFTQLNRAREDGWEAEFRAAFPKPER